MGDRGDRETAIHRSEVENPLWANEWRRARVGLATRQRSDRELEVQGPRGQRDQIGPGVGLADRGLRARARRGRRAAAGPGGQHGPPSPGVRPGKRSRAAAVPAPLPRVPHLRGLRGVARRRGRPAGTAAAGGGGVS